MNELIGLMAKIENPGTFAVSGTLEAVPPGLKVKGLGLVSLPVPKAQAEALIALSEQAPYGRGEETIVDTKVRNTWQISATDFELSNPQWDKALQKIINETIGHELGLYDCKIQGTPYKLLIYGKGSFFAAHRDTEKIPNMFATLTISLPSEHEGGELLISHGGETRRYSFAEMDMFQSHFVAFYADCFHEVKPVTSGYRVCLIYNLAITNRKKQPLLSEQQDHIENVSRFVEKWAAKVQEKPHLVYLLEHDYTEENLSLANLKNGDFAKVSVLLNAAGKNDCQAFLCLVSYCRTSYGSVGYYDRYSRYSKDVDEDDFEEDGDVDEEIFAHCFLTAKGEKININKLALEEDELIAKTPLLEGPGRDVEVSEATGNEGATKALWYHRGAVIMWPKSRDAEMIAKMDVGYGVYYLRQALREQDISTARNRSDIIRLAEHLLEKLTTYSREDISNELMAIGDAELMRKLIRKKLREDNSLLHLEAGLVLPIAERFGWGVIESEINDCLTTKRDAIPWISGLLTTQLQSAEGRACLKEWFEAVWNIPARRSLTKGELPDTLKVISILGLRDYVAEIIEKLAAQQQPAFLTDTYGPVIVKALKELKNVAHDHAIMTAFRDDARQRIQAEFPAPPEKPTDWSRSGKLTCACAFCAKVNQFLPDPREREIYFSKVLRRDLTHLEEQIEKSRVDLEIIVRRMPPKFAGTCRKTQRSYDEKLKLYSRAQEIVAALRE